MQCPRGLAALELPQPSIQSVPRQKRFVSAPFYDLPVVQHQDFIGPHNRAEAVSDGDRRPAIHQNREGSLDLRLDFGIYGAGRLIEHQ